MEKEGWGARRKLALAQGVRSFSSVDGKGMGSVDEEPLLVFLREEAHTQGWQALSGEEKAKKQTEGKAALEKEATGLAEEVKKYPPNKTATAAMMEEESMKATSIKEAKMMMSGKPDDAELLAN